MSTSIPTSHNEQSPRVNAASDPTAPTAPEDTQYPEQIHAGAVGYGPNYNQGASFGDKVSGLTQEVKGKVLRKPDVAEHGKQLRTGELKRKEEEENDTNPFEAAKQDDSTAPPTKDIDHPK